MWNALTTSASIQEAYQTLLARYDVAPEVLRRDLQQLVDQLLVAGLLELAGG
jgi:DeoR/GlpR family transcriptional regulator of sugar metabolism